MLLHELKEHFTENNPADCKCLAVKTSSNSTFFFFFFFFFQHPPAAPAYIISFKLGTHSNNGLVVHLGMYVALPRQQILSDFDTLFQQRRVYLTRH